MKLFKLSLGLVMAFAAGSAQATVLNFISMADGNVYGESGYSSLDIGLVSITSTKGGASAFSYLDRSNAGLGVCGFVGNTGLQGNSGSNLCLDAAGGPAAGDDNVTTAEALSFVFSEAVTITNIWFNNNHDGGFDATDLITIEGTNYSAVTGYAGDANAYSTWNMAAGVSFDVAHLNEEFYVSAIEFSRQPGGGCTENCTVPEPGVLALLAVGLIAGGLVRRRKHS
jgi:hypothetical protein